MATETPLTPASWARDSRLAQGLPAKVEDPETLRKLAELVKERAA